jgi:hypothetical protein
MSKILRRQAGNDALLQAKFVAKTQNLARNGVEKAFELPSKGVATGGRLGSTTLEGLLEGLLEQRSDRVAFLCRDLPVQFTGSTCRFNSPARPL